MGQVREVFVRNRENDMSAVVLAKGWLLRFPRKPTDTKERWFERAARFFEIHPRKAKKLFYDEIDRMDADEMLGMCRNFLRLESSILTMEEGLNELEALARKATAEAGYPQGAQGQAGD